MRASLRFVLVSWTLGSCGGAERLAVPDGAEDPDSSTDDAAMGREDAGAGGDPPGRDAGEQGEPDGGLVEPTSVRFVVLGDAGTAGPEQLAVAAAMKTVCDMRGCDFALFLGDNIYDAGVTAVDDEQFRTKFEDPYAELDFPFYVSLGNHDYGGFPAGSNFLIDDTRSALQVEYTARSEKWYMPEFFYSKRVGPVELFALDTNAIVVEDYRPLAVQQAWLDERLEQSTAPWKIVFGHHPYLSNGDHGNAGSYDINKCVLGVCPDNGAPMKALVEESICGKAQVHFAGHDHNREWLEPTCGTTFIVSGGGGKDLRPVNMAAENSLFADATKYGFLWAEIDGDTMTGVFYDAAGNIDYEDLVTR